LRSTPERRFVYGAADVAKSKFGTLILEKITFRANEKSLNGIQN